jgi:hypothetical protein
MWKTVESILYPGWCNVVLYGMQRWKSEIRGYA